MKISERIRLEADLAKLKKKYNFKGVFLIANDEERIHFFKKYADIYFISIAARLLNLELDSKLLKVRE